MLKVIMWNLNLLCTYIAVKQRKSTLLNKCDTIYEKKGCIESKKPHYRYKQ